MSDIREDGQFIQGITDVLNSHDASSQCSYGMCWGREAIIKLVESREAALSQQHDREIAKARLEGAASVTTDKGDAYYQGVPTWRIREQLQQQSNGGETK